MLSIFHCSKLLQKIPIVFNTNQLFHQYPHSISHKTYANNIYPFAYSYCLSTASTQTLIHKSSSSYSYTVNYLIHSCGLSLESAISASKKVNFETSERPDSVIQILKNHGFNKTHIFHFVRKCPRLLLTNTEKTLLPKLNFYYSIGFSKADIGRLLSFNPLLFSESLENQIIPAYKFLISVVPSDKKVMTVLNRIWCAFTPKNIVPNVNVLRELSVPESCIQLLTTNFPMIMFQTHGGFLEAVNRVNKIGFDHEKTNFVLAVRVLSGTSFNLMWGRCTDTYKKWGWSEDDILSAFKKQPLCMTLSAKKINRAMGVFVNKMGYEPKEISRMPPILLYDVEKRIIPRCKVIQMLTSKSLLKKVGLGSVLTPSDKIFLKRYVTRYEDKVPHLMSVYQEKINGQAS